MKEIECLRLRMKEIRLNIIVHAFLSHDNYVSKHCQLALSELLGGYKPNLDRRGDRSKVTFHLYDTQKQNCLNPRLLHSKF